MAESWKQLCLFCRGEGIICVEREGDLGTYVECGYCDALADDVYEEPTGEYQRPDQYSMYEEFDK